MAKVSIKIKKPTGSTFRSWAFVLFAGLVLATIAVIDSGRLAPVPVVAPADGPVRCQFRVTVTTAAGSKLNVRVAPDLSSTSRGMLSDGEVIDGTPVVQGAFRQLEGGLWASAANLTPVSGETCS